MTEPNEEPWPEIEGLVQMHMAVFVKGKGWLTTRRSIIYGGRHGEAPLITDDTDKLVETLALDVRMGVQAMKYRLRHPKLEYPEDHPGEP